MFNCRHADGYRDKRVVVVGAGNTACDAAVDLSSLCSQVIRHSANIGLFFNVMANTVHHAPRACSKKGAAWFKPSGIKEQVYTDSKATFKSVITRPAVNSHLFSLTFIFDRILLSCFICGTR